MKLVYFGSGSFGVPTLEALHNRHDLALIVTQPNRPAGRGGRSSPTAVRQWAQAHDLDERVIAEPSVNAEQIRARIRAVPADGFVVIAFGQKLGRKLLEERFAINLHASLLPRWRGAAPINAAIASGDDVTGNSVISLAERMDAGVVYGRSRRQIDPETTAGELHDMLAGDGPVLMLDVLAARRSGSLRGESQDERAVTLAPKLSRGDGWVRFDGSAEKCRCRINGLSPWPGVGALIEAERVKLVRAGRAEDEPGHLPGTLIDAVQGIVACGEGALRLLEVQPAGKRVMAWSEFVRGRAIAAGDEVVPERCADSGREKRQP